MGFLKLLKVVAPGTSRRLGPPERAVVHTLSVFSAALLLAISFGTLFAINLLERWMARYHA